MTRKTVELHAKRADAADAELKAIRSEHPLHNIAGRSSGPFGIDPGDLPKAVRPADVIELVMLEMPPQSLRLALLELVGIPTGAALETLGTDPSKGLAGTISSASLRSTIPSRRSNSPSAAT